MVHGVLDILLTQIPPLLSHSWHWESWAPVHALTASVHLNGVGIECAKASAQHDQHVRQGRPRSRVPMAAAHLDSHKRPRLLQLPCRRMSSRARRRMCSMPRQCSS